MNACQSTSPEGQHQLHPQGVSVGAPCEYLIFRLGAEEYGIDILRVQEIRSYEEPVRIASATHFIKGVINLRGVIVPIVDLRLKLGCEKVEFSDCTVVIVINVLGRILGAVVDSVSDVVLLSHEAIKPLPSMSAQSNDAFITDIANIGERMLVLIDIAALIGSADLGLIDAITEQNPLQVTAPVATAATTVL